MFRRLPLICFAIILYACAHNPKTPKISPIHLDDIHFIVTDEPAAVSFFETKFSAREMAHPGERFDLVRFLSVKWQDPTLTITRIGPYDDLPANRNERWLNATFISPGSAKLNPYYGVRWVAFSTPSLDQARRNILAAGGRISEGSIALPLEPDAKAFSVYGPDNAEIVIVERRSKDFEGASFAIDHIQFLTADAEAMQTFFTDVFSGSTLKETETSISLKVADALIIVSEPEVFGYTHDAVSPASRDGAVQLGVGHLGFLYADIQSAVDQAALLGYDPLFPPTRYIYKNKPTVYTFTAFASPDNFNIEMVQPDGRVGPHSYYDRP